MTLSSGHGAYEENVSFNVRLVTSSSYGDIQCSTS